eukprot:gene17625-biopygen17833
MLNDLDACSMSTDVSTLNTMVDAVFGPSRPMPRNVNRALHFRENRGLVQMGSEADDRESSRNLLSARSMLNSPVSSSRRTK